MTRVGGKLFSVLLALAIATSYVPHLKAQTQNTGAIQGRVFEAVSIAPLPGAVVTVTHEDIGLERSIVTDNEGYYYVGILPAGRYRISASLQGYENDPDPKNSIITGFLIHITNTEKADQPPPIILRKTAAPSQPTTSQPTTPAPSTPQPQPTSPPVAQPPVQPPRQVSARDESDVSLLVNTTNATRGGSFGELPLLTLPLPGVRTFDDLAFLVPGVFAAPQAIGTTVGPGIGPGVGSSGQFSVNGLRSRSNNFTIDGSDNNDEEIGVRRQGFTSLIPQSIESIQEFQISTLLPEPQYGRNLGAQVNAVSRSGGGGYHGTVYGFLTDKRLRARDPFDFAGGPASTTLVANGRTVQLNGQDLTVDNPVDDENSFTRAQYGFVIGGPLVNRKTHFFASFEHQDINASRESHFAVPTVAERGLFNTGATGFPVSVDGVIKELFPTSSAGDAFFSLFPFPNNPIGPYGPNTFTEVLPASADGTIFSGKLDHNIGKNHTLMGRYNFTDDNTILPVTGEAIFSSLRALIRTQNFALSFSSALSNNVANQARFSYGRTSLNFEEVRNPMLLPSEQFPDVPFLLNAPLLQNFSLPGDDPSFRTFLTAPNTERITGPLGQVRVSGYSPIGVDVFYFPQARTNNTFQYADTLVYNRQRHRFTAGFDIRQNQLDNRLDRNSRPLAVFSASKDLSNVVDNLPGSRPGRITDEFSSAVSGFLLGRDFVAVGAPTGFFQTQSTVSDPTIRLRYLQNDFFFSDQMRLGSNFTLTLGVRYELNTVPTEVDQRIESTFDSQPVKDFIAFERDFMRNNRNRDVSGLEQFLGGRTKIYEQDNNNVAPHVAFAWDPFGKGTTSIRAGYGIYYDQIPGFVISQSSGVFPSFLNLNFAGGIRDVGEGAPLLQNLRLSNPASIAAPGTLNTFDSQSNPDPFIFILQQELATAFASAPTFVLPAADLVTPYAHHWGITIEQAFMRDFLASVAYVGTKGTHLLRTATPNLGPNSIPIVDSIQVRNDCNSENILTCFPIFNGIVVPPAFGRPFPLLGSITTFESDANSSYHSLQLQLLKRFSNGIQFTTAYTWSHAIDEASDLFDLAGTRALPQDSFDRRAERADAGFDVRHRFVYSFIWDLPVFRENSILGGWQLASIGTFQTGQPYTLLNCCDVNLDGNLTDRIGTRNSFRAPGIEKVDMALNKNFRFGEHQRLEVRTEVFNLFNRVHFGIPVHQLFFGNLTDEAISEKHFVDTRLPQRTIQFALKYSF
ncbi:MAG: carboxypeptidase-like regulatory domain-containing protein [Blastocatellia bacterium]